MKKFLKLFICFTLVFSLFSCKTKSEFFVNLAIKNSNCYVVKTITLKNNRYFYEASNIYGYTLYLRSTSNIYEVGDTLTIVKK